MRLPGPLRRAIRSAERHLPSLGVRVDAFRPSVRDSLGGPMNGQAARTQLVRSLAQSYDCELVIETGTFRGSTTEFLDDVFGTPVITVEFSKRHWRFSQLRLKNRPNVSVRLGDSRSVLRTLATDTALTGLRTFFYLDAHWGADLPLREELELISSAWATALVMIDDFEVPGDPGYGFDAYGPGKALTPSYLHEARGWSAYKPSTPSSEETGAKRGCIVLATRDAVAAADASALLEPILITQG